MEAGGRLRPCSGYRCVSYDCTECQGEHWLAVHKTVSKRV